MSFEKDLVLSPVDSVKIEEKSRVYDQGGADNDLYEDGSVDPVYQAKARLLNCAIQEIGMGKYQVRVAYQMP